MSERELFRRSYDIDAETLWAALRRALRTMDLKEVDEAERSARFSTGVLSWWSWGQHNLALVEEEGGRSRLVVRGRPKASLFTTDWGERRHARQVEKQLVDAVDSELPPTTRP
ncbi:MAG TPA: hypothetical protein VGJ70_12220 [Solirubrobacteraceae bacterium]|jgi:hypothetical protein